MTAAVNLVAALEIVSPKGCLERRCCSQMSSGQWCRDRPRVRHCAAMIVRLTIFNGGGGRLGIFLLQHIIDRVNFFTTDASFSTLPIILAIVKSGSNFVCLAPGPLSATFHRGTS